MTRCDFVSLPSGRQIHYRRAGQGPPLVILHPSPQSSQAMGAAIDAFKTLCTCFALDTPGYGLSDDMVKDDPGMVDYADTLVQAIDRLGIGQFYLYGAATGSQIGIEIAKRCPSRVRFLMLDANGHLSEDEQERKGRGYFPDVTPRRDGGHLLTYWDMCRNLFHAFPWNSTRLEDRFASGLPPVTVIQDTLLRYFQAGSGYWKAYKLAFKTEKRAHLNGLTVPAVMTRWEGSSVLSLADNLIALGLPETVRLLEAGPTLGERFAVQVAALKDAAATYPVEPAAAQAFSLPSGPSLGRHYLSSDEGRIHTRISHSGSGNPVIILHGGGESGDQMLALANDLVGHRPVILPDLPGHGASFKVTEGSALSVEMLASALSEALLDWKSSGASIVGRGLGGAVGAAVASSLDADRLWVIDPWMVGAQETQRFRERGIRHLSPRLDGTHLIEAWAMVRDSMLYDPWYDTAKGAMRACDPDLSPRIMHQKVVDIFRTRGLWPWIGELEVDLDWSAILAKAPVAHDVLLTKGHPNSERVMRLIGHAGVQSAPVRSLLSDLANLLISDS